MCTSENLSKNSKISSVKISCHGILHQQQISACWKLIGIIILNFITNTSLLFHTDSMHVFTGRLLK